MVFELWKNDSQIYAVLPTIQYLKVYEVGEC